MAWRNPLPYELVVTDDPLSFSSMPAMTTGLPVGAHPGAFGVKRRYHTHEGVDLYCPRGTPVSAVEEGVVIAVRVFTGPALGHTWWLQTHAVWVQGPSGVVVYGEIAPHVTVGQRVNAGELLGVVIPVLKNNKGRPGSMLHLEIRADGRTEDIEWLDHDKKPEALRDPTPYLMHCVTHEKISSMT